MLNETHTLMDGKVHVYKRGRSRFWQCSTYMDGRNHRVSTKEEILKLALEFAREWYMRHTYICLRLMEGADIYQVAKNCRTSVEMIEKFYAVHLKNTLDASAINVRKPKKKTEKQTDKQT